MPFLNEHQPEILNEMQGLTLSLAGPRGKASTPYLVRSPSQINRDTLLTRSSTNSDYSDRSSWANNSPYMSSHAFFGGDAMDSSTYPNSGNVTPLSPADGHFTFEQKQKPDFGIAKPLVSNERVMERYIPGGYDQQLSKRKGSKINSVVGGSLESSLSQIVYLDLSTSTTTSQMIASTGRLPRWLQKCTNLKFLIAKDVGLRVIDDWVSTYLINLKVLRLDNNDISTWPDHLARLIPYGKLAVLSLEGNPCLVGLVKRSQSFKEVYLEPIKVLFGPDQAAKLEEATLAVKTITKESKAPKNKMTKFFKNFRKDKGLVITEHQVDAHDSDNLGLTQTFSNIAQLTSNAFTEDGKLKSAMVGGTASVARYSPNEDPNNRAGNDSYEDSDDDMLTSLGPKHKTKVLRKHSSAANLQRTESSTAMDTATNTTIEPLEVAKTRIMFALLQNVYELNTRKGVIASYKEQMEVQGVDISHFKAPSGFHSRANSADSGVKSQSQANSNSRQIPPTLRVYEALHACLITYHNHMRLLGEWEASYNMDSCRKDVKVKVSKLFTGLKEILDANKRLLPRMVGAIERIKQGFDPDYDHIFRSLNQGLDDLVEPLFRYADNYEQNRRQAREYLSLFKATTSANFYGSAAANFVPSDHQDVEAAEWLRACAKKPTHSLDSVLNYIDEPIKFLESFTIRSQEMLTYMSSPIAQLVCSRVKDIQLEIEMRRPRQINALKKQELFKLFKIKTDYGDYLDDAHVFVESVTSLVSAKSNDVLYTEGPGKSVPRCLEFKLNDRMRPTRGQSFRLLNFSKAVIFIDETRQAITKVCKRDTFDLTEPSEFIGSQPQTGLQGPLLKRLVESVRMIFYDQQEVWYCNVKGYSGSCSKRLNETNGDVFLRAMHQTPSY